MSAHSRRPSVNPDGIGSLKKAAPKEDSKNMGFLYTGYLDKRNPVTGSYKQRFVVLAHDAIHWFKRLDKDALFAAELYGFELMCNVIKRITTAIPT